MVDFSKHLKNPHPAPDPSIISGALITRIEPKNRDPFYRGCQWEIGPYNSNTFGTWTCFNITEGGVTGYESFVLKDDRGLNLDALNRIFKEEPNGVWYANAGGGGWDAMIIPNRALREAIQQWLDREGIAYPQEQ